MKSCMKQGTFEHGECRVVQFNSIPPVFIFISPKIFKYFHLDCSLAEMSVEEEQVQAPSPEECTTDNTPHVMPTESHESPAILSPIGCGIFQGSATSHLGLSGFGNSSDNAAEEMSKCHASLFEDDQNFAFGVCFSYLGNDCASFLFSNIHSYFAGI